MGLHNFRGLGGEKSLVYRDLQMGRSTVKKLSPYFALLFNNNFAVEGRGMPFPPPPRLRGLRGHASREQLKKTDINKMKCF